jgi:TIR domain-containing protein
MPLSTRPVLVIYVVWHPEFAEGAGIAKALYDHYRRNLYENVAGGAGLSLIYRSTPEPGTSAPVGIDFNEAETSAVVLLVDERFAADGSFVAYARDLMDQADAVGLSARIFPVAIDKIAIDLEIAEQFIRWDRWLRVDQKKRRCRLIARLTYQFCRMLRSYLERLEHPAEEDATLEQYLRRVQIFLSHSKHDQNGDRIARMIRDYLHRADSLASFFDVHDIPAGLRFNKIILQQVKVSAVVAIHTDSYSSREWCRREIIEAKRWNVPLVVANCITDVDERSFPYMGNVPVVRMEPRAAGRIESIVSRLLDEVLKDFLWRCRVDLARNEADASVEYLPRPPELISLVAMRGEAEAEVTLVYPDPPLGAEEQRLFEVIAPKVRLRSITEWLAETAA